LGLSLSEGLGVNSAAAANRPEETLGGLRYSGLAIFSSIYSDDSIVLAILDIKYQSRYASRVRHCHLSSPSCCTSRYHATPAETCSQHPAEKMLLESTT
jgi:hypothetical protein